MEVLLALSNTIRLVSVVVKRFFKICENATKTKVFESGRVIDIIATKLSHIVINADAIAEIATNCLEK
jgi:hypothetical protein